MCRAGLQIPLIISDRRGHANARSRRTTSASLHADTVVGSLINSMQRTFTQFAVICC